MNNNINNLTIQAKAYGIKVLPLDYGWEVNLYNKRHVAYSEGSLWHLLNAACKHVERKNKCFI